MQRSGAGAKLGGFWLCGHHEEFPQHKFAARRCQLFGRKRRAATATMAGIQSSHGNRSGTTTSLAMWPNPNSAIHGRESPDFSCMCISDFRIFLYLGSSLPAPPCCIPMNQEAGPTFIQFVLTQGRHFARCTRTVPALCTKLVQDDAQPASWCLVPVIMSLVMHLYVPRACFALTSSALVCVVVHPFR